MNLLIVAPYEASGHSVLVKRHVNRGYDSAQGTRIASYSITEQGRQGETSPDFGELVAEPLTNSSHVAKPQELCLVTGKITVSRSAASGHGCGGMLAQGQKFVDRDSPLCPGGGMSFGYDVLDPRLNVWRCQICLSPSLALDSSDLPFLWQSIMECIFPITMSFGDFSLDESVSDNKWWWKSGALATRSRDNPGRRGSGQLDVV